MAAAAILKKSKSKIAISRPVFCYYAHSSVMDLWTRLWGRYHVSQNVFLALFISFLDFSATTKISITSMSVQFIVRPKCTLVASHAAPGESRYGTDRQTDARDRYITHSAMDADSVISIGQFTNSCCHLNLESDRLGCCVNSMCLGCIVTYYFYQHLWHHCKLGLIYMTITVVSITYCLIPRNLYVLKLAVKGRQPLIVWN